MTRWCEVPVEEIQPGDQLDDNTTVLAVLPDIEQIEVLTSGGLSSLFRRGNKAQVGRTA